MSCEIELKLRMPPAQVRRLMTHPLLAGIKEEKFRLFNTYYDTPELELYRRGIALRLRRKGNSTWLMTVKGGGEGTGGLTQRPEWEVPTRPGTFDFSIVGDSRLRTFLQKRESSLLPIFTTDFTRTSWHLNRSGADVELALDRGKISATPLSGTPSSVSENLCELELELQGSASTDPLFELAIELAGELHLHPELVSKAERGYSLATGALPRPTKGLAATVHARMSPVEAFRSIALACLAQLQRNEVGAIANENPEYLHQIRVTIRRLRSALKFFSPVLSAEFLAVYSPRWQALDRRLGRARDWDVFLAETLILLEKTFPGSADLAGLREQAMASQSANFDHAGAHVLMQQDYSQLLLAFSAALFRETAPTIGTTTVSVCETRLRRFAVRRLRKFHKDIGLQVDMHRLVHTEQCHELRIKFKKLRYMLDFLSPIFPRKRFDAYQLILMRVQGLLGAVNDQATAVRLVRALRPASMAESLVNGWAAGRDQLLLSALRGQLKSFLSSDKPW